MQQGEGSGTSPGSLLDLKMVHRQLGKPGAVSSIRPGVGQVCRALRWDGRGCRRRASWNLWASHEGIRLGKDTFLKTGLLKQSLLLYSDTIVGIFKKLTSCKEMH